jgi:uncharacterized protein
MQENTETTNEQIQEVDLNNSPRVAPTLKQERIEVLDVIRGFAILGIFLVHMPLWFGFPGMYLEMLGALQSMWTNVWDTTASSFVNLFVLGKFYTMFSFLFGLGFVIFYERAKARSSRATLLFYKRLFVLMVIGLLHAFFIWHGDILVAYALFGLLLPLFFSRKLKTILIWAAVFIFLFVSIVSLGILGISMMDEVTLSAVMQPIIERMKGYMDSSIYAYGQGNFAAIMAQRTADTLFGYGQLWAMFFLVFPLFLLGVYVGKRGIFQNIEANLSFIKKAWKWGLIIGLSMSIVKFITADQINNFLPNIHTLIFYVSSILGDTGLSIFYMTSIILLFQSKNWMLKLKPFGYVGRMALSNYLFQSIIATMIFYNYGLGLYGQIGPALGLLFVVVIFIGQILISKYWLERYQFGPMEWVWKSLTYGKIFSNKNKDKEDIAEMPAGN